PPVNLHREQPLASYDKVCALLGLFNLRRFILARHPDQDTGLGQRLEELLVEAVYVTVVVEVPGHAAHADFAQDTAPEGIVEVGDEALLRRCRLQEQRQQLGQDRRVTGPVWESGRQLSLDIQT